MINLEQQGLSIATYRPSGFRSGGRIVLDDAACFRLRLQPLTDSWQVKHQEKLSTLRINPYRRKTNGSKERILELEFATRCH